MQEVQLADEHALTSSKLQMMDWLAECRGCVHEICSKPIEELLERASTFERMQHSRAACVAMVGDEQMSAKDVVSLKKWKDDIALPILTKVVEAGKAQVNQVMERLKEQLRAKVERLRPLSRGNREGKSWKDKLAKEPSWIQIVNGSQQLLSGAVGVELFNTYKDVRSDC